MSQTFPGYREEDGDYFGKYCGDIYGCGSSPGMDDACNKCVRCNTTYYWTVRRKVKRPDHPSVKITNNA